MRVWDHFEKCRENPLFVNYARSRSPTMALGAFSLPHDAIASNNDNDVANHKTLSILQAAKLVHSTT